MDLYIFFSYGAEMFPKMKIQNCTYLHSVWTIRLSHNCFLALVGNNSTVQLLSVNKWIPSCDANSLFPPQLAAKNCSSVVLASLLHNCTWL